MARVFIPGFRKIETSGGGEGGTTNYADLENKPSINNVPLAGNLRTVDLKLTDATLTEEGVPAEAKTVGAKLEEHSTSLTALSEQLGNHTVKSDVPENAVFTDTVYDDTEVKESIDELNSNLDRLKVGENSATRNLFNVDLIENYYISMSDGEFKSSGDWSATKDYIEIKPNTTYTLSGIGVSGDLAGYAFYDSNKNFIVSTQSNTFTTPDNAKYIRVCTYNDFLTNPQLEEGTQATQYEPYIPSVKMLADEVNAQNESLADYGLDNKFDGKLEQGYKNASGTIIWDSTNVCIKNIISVSSGDKVTVKLDSVAKRLYTTYRNNGVLVSEEVNYNTNNVTVTIPSGANGLDITMVYDSTTTPSQVGNLYVYINNEIAELKNDLGGLSFSVNGTTLSITDGTNTWTLSQ